MRPVCRVVHTHMSPSSERGLSIRSFRHVSMRIPDFDLFLPSSYYALVKCSHYQEPQRTTGESQPGTRQTRAPYGVDKVILLFYWSKRVKKIRRQIQQPFGKHYGPSFTANEMPSPFSYFQTPSRKNHPASQRWCCVSLQQSPIIFFELSWVEAGNRKRPHHRPRSTTLPTLGAGRNRQGDRVSCQGPRIDLWIPRMDRGRTPPRPLSLDENNSLERSPHANTWSSFQVRLVEYRLYPPQPFLFPCQDKLDKPEEVGT